ncbi:hypothetical protein PGS54_05320 [Yersinia mollaretii]|nr:hypothetical protein [Yersinia mollaretii]MDA5526971.1 hypothetical protein [Yersinia mollaretii]MDA5534446.1 hypothetical protein [Yersinia mollaretii]
MLGMTQPKLSNMLRGSSEALTRPRCWSA